MITFEKLSSDFQIYTGEIDGRINVALWDDEDVVIDKENVTIILTIDEIRQIVSEFDDFMKVRGK